MSKNLPKTVFYVNVVQHVLLVTYPTTALTHIKPNFNHKPLVFEKS